MTTSAYLVETGDGKYQPEDGVGVYLLEDGPFLPLDPGATGRVRLTGLAGSVGRARQAVRLQRQSAGVEVTRRT